MVFQIYNFFPVEDYDTYINQSNRIKYTGKIWQLHKPSQDGTLYTQILQEPQNIQVHTVFFKEILFIIKIFIVGSSYGIITAI